MPAMTGYELYARLVELGHEIPTILVTAYPNDAAYAFGEHRGPLRAAPYQVSLR
jgi:CheY-like chemotaxis protein